MWIEPKTDWTEQDVYNLSVDLTRVEGNIREVLHLVQAAGYEVSLNEKLTWSMSDFLTAAQLGRIVDNLFELERVITVPDGLPSLPVVYSQMRLTANIANALEAHTLALKQVADSIAALYVPCGTTQSGARPLLPQQSIGGAVS